MSDWQLEALKLAEFALLRFRYFAMADLDELSDRLHLLVNAVIHDDEKKAKIHAQFVKAIIEEN